MGDGDSDNANGSEGGDGNGQWKGVGNDGGYKCMPGGEVMVILIMFGDHGSDNTVVMAMKLSMHMVILTCA